MKNMNKRTKMILTVVGVLLVVVIAVAVFFQASGDSLFGTVYSLKISPSSSTIVVGESAMLSSGTILSTCSWSSSNPAIAWVTDSTTRSATVRGNTVGTVTITETCGALGRYHGYATVTVNAAPVPPTPLSPSTFDLLTTDDIQEWVIWGNTWQTCSWSANPTGIIELSPRDDYPGWLYIRPLAVGQTQVNADCEDAAGNHGYYVGTAVVSKP